MCKLNMFFIISAFSQLHGIQNHHIKCLLSWIYVEVILD